MTPTRNHSAVFPLLADPSAYVACPWDLTTDATRRVYWLGVFRKHWPTLLKHAIDEAEDRGVDAAQACERADARFTAYLDAVERDPDAFGRLDVLSICLHREDALREANLDDPYRLLKQTENDRAIRLLPALLNQLDAADQSDRDRLLIEGVFAGNIFDMGAEQTQRMFESGSVDFAAVRDRLKPRPWRYDALDVWSKRVRSRPYQAAVLFVDNAGPDVLLGMIPLARELVRLGTQVVLTANTEPSLNDVTHDELVGLVQAIAGFDEVTRHALADQRLRLIASGNRAPLIDLTRISAELASTCENLPIDLVVLEGMGRSMESNPNCAMTCDCLRLAMVKDEGVADSFDADMFDLVMRYAQV